MFPKRKTDLDEDKKRRESRKKCRDRIREREGQEEGELCQAGAVYIEPAGALRDSTMAI